MESVQINCLAQCLATEASNQCQLQLQARHEKRYSDGVPGNFFSVGMSSHHKKIGTYI